MRTKLKSFLSLFLVVILLFSVVPVGISAASNSVLTIAGTKIESDGYWINDGNGGITTEGASSENYNLKVTFETLGINLVIKSLSISDQILCKKTMNIEVLGENSITFVFNKADYKAAIYNSGIGSINLGGSGTLNINTEEDNASSTYVDLYGIQANDVTFKDSVKVNVNVSTNSVESDAVGIYTKYGYVKDSAQVTIKAQGGAGACGWAVKNIHLNDKGVLKTNVYDLLADDRKSYNRHAYGISCSYEMELSGSFYLEAINTCDTDNVILNEAVSARDLKMTDNSKIVAKSSSARCYQNVNWSEKVGSIAIDVDRSLTLSNDAEIIAESGNILMGYDAYSIAIDLGYSDDKEEIYMDGLLQLSDNASVSAKAGNGNRSIGINTTELHASGNSKIDSVSGYASKDSIGICAKKIMISENCEATFASGDVDTKDYEYIFSSTGYLDNSKSVTAAVKSNEIYISDTAKVSAVAANATVTDNGDRAESYGICVGKMALTDNVQVEAVGGKIIDPFRTNEIRHISAGVCYNNENTVTDKIFETSGSAELTATGGFYGIRSKYDISFKDDSEIYAYGYYYATSEFGIAGRAKVELASDSSAVDLGESNFGIEIAEDFEPDIMVSKNTDFKDAMVWDGSTHLDNYKSLKTDKDINLHSYSVTRKDFTCDENGYMLYSCDHCGDSYKIIVVSPGHIMKAERIKGSCTEKSQNIYSCYNCEFSYFVEGSYNHKFTEWTVVEEATCEKNGIKKRNCELCGKEETQTIWASHNYDRDNPIIIKEPTCNGSGTKAYKCLTCGYLGETRTISALGHNYTITETVENCQKIITETCVNCNLTYVTKQSAHVLQPEIRPQTCTEDGMTMEKCVVCDKVIFSDVYTKRGHYYQSEIIEPTATEDGYIKYTCKNCEDSYNVNLPSTGCEHSYELQDSVLPTCGSEGSETYVCSKCEDSYEVLICRNEHNWIFLGKQEPSCYIEGFELSFCEDCFNGRNIIETKFIVIPKTDHSYTTERVEPTATQDGYIKYTCSVCGDTYTEVLPSTGDECLHSFTKISVPSTCKVQGMEYDLCSFCGITANSKVLPLAEHNLTHYSEASTCKEQGYEYDKCTYCEGVFNQVDLPLAEHNLTHYSEASTCKEQGYEYDKCTYCEGVFNHVDLPLAEHNLTHYSEASTCKEQGYEYDKCTYCEGVFNQVDLPLAEHSRNDWTVVKESTAEAEGEEQRSCVVCGDIETRAIPKLNKIKDENTGIEIVYKDEYDSDVEIEVEPVFDGDSYQIIESNYGNTNSKIFDISTVKNGEKVQPNGKVKVRIPVPADFTGNTIFVCYVDSINGTVEKIPAVVKNGYIEFEASHFSYYAIVEQLIVSAVIRTPSISTVKYGDSIILHSDLSEDLPIGWRVEWSVNNSYFDYAVSVDGSTCTITPNKSGETTFTVTVYDADGNEVTRDEQTMKSKAGIFDKFVAFLKKLFGMTKTYPQIFKGAY